MQKTAVIQIGNSDDKLSQGRWSDYVKAVQDLVELYAQGIHFFGGPPNWEEWQNVCWVFVIEEEDVEILKMKLFTIRKLRGQDSVALSISDTQFV